MKKHTPALQCLAVALLVCFDQAVKLFVSAFVPLDSLNSVLYIQSDAGWFLFHIHPELHRRFSVFGNVLIAFLMAALSAYALFLLKNERTALLSGIPGAEAVKTCPKLTKAAIIFWLAGMFSSVIFDAFFWGGSLDFICFEWATFQNDLDGVYTLIHQFNFDLKDAFIYIACLLILVRAAVWQFSLFKLPKSDRKLITKRSHRFVRSLREARGEQIDVSGKNSIADVFVLVIGGTVLSAGLGYLLFCITVWFIIPLAVEISPTLYSLLSKIGDENDPDMIYQTIRGACQLICVFPAMALSNAEVKNRERHFIHDTNGMIVTLDGLRYHFGQHTFYDAVSVAGIAAIGLVFHLFAPKSVSPFELVYEALGIPLGLAASAAFIAAAQLCGVIIAQKRWRAEYFYVE